LSRSNPLLQVLSLVVAAVLLGLAFVIGMVVVGVLLAVGAVAAIAFAARIWWLQRTIRGSAAGHHDGRSARHVIEGSYTVVGESDAKDSRSSSNARGGAEDRPRGPAD
jgi:hypothetical protein